MTKEVKNLWRNPHLWVTILGVALVPTLYNLVFLTSLWNPYGNLNQLPVAIVNQDKSADFNHKKINAGDKIVDKMSKSKDLDYHFVTAKTANKGLKDGKYYMVVTFPKDLSEKSSSILTDNPEKPIITYQTSKGHNFVSSKMGQSAMLKLEAKVSEEVTKAYNKNLFTNLVQLQKGLGKAAKGSKDLANGANEALDGSQQITNNLLLLANAGNQLSSGASQLNDGIGQYTSGVGQLNTGIGKLSTGLTTYTNGVSQLSQGANQLNANSQNLKDGANQIAGGASQMQELVDGASKLNAGLVQLQTETSLSPEQTASIQALQTGLPAIQQGINQLNKTVAELGNQSATTTTTTSPSLSQAKVDLTSIISQADTIISATTSDKATITASVQGTSAYQSLTPAQQAEISNAISATPQSSNATAAQAIKSAAGELQTTLDQVTGQSSTTTTNPSASLGQLQTSVATLNNNANVVLPGAVTALNTLSGGLAEVNSNSSKMVAASSRILGGVQGLQTTLATNGSKLANGITQYTDGVGQLASGANQLSGNNAQLTSGVAGLSSGASTLDSKSGDLTAGAGKLSDGASQLAQGSGKIAQGGNQLSTGISALSDGAATLSDKLALTDQKLATLSFKKSNSKELANPIATKHVDKDNVKTNGVGMAPYMISVSLLVAALSANVIFADSLAGKKHETRMEWAKSKLFINGLISTLAAIMLYALVRILGMDPSYPVATFVMILLSSWASMAIVTALLGWDKRFGAFGALILLLLQLGSSEGTYPLQIIPRFFTKIHPFLPMSYSVSGLRQALSLNGEIGHQASMLALFTVGAIMVGLLIYRQNKKD